ncbi:ABC transporter substrate-binding protein [Microbacterium sp. RURRCA19A]|uniref:ABC transporter substrate-binding protein n=1 Tax=Microbacterium sp. RURRCA19A TaxID=1907391 RepID=UPI0009569F74|nr:ABC transporter substrate-binding protein [Microbacterium sp. RURRCA19A]SIR64759.1 branched-chain amino acid transport system substrate-binding protein [Microbacterium sp. RURRCA19A]
MRRTVPLAATAALALALTACSGGTATSSASGPVKIGMVVPLTGFLSALGQGDKEAAERAVADINAAGGIDGRQVQLTVVDDKADVTESVKQFNQLASDPSYSAMLASSFVSAATAVGSTAQSAKIPTIALSPVDAFADGSNPYAFTSPPVPAVYARALVDYWVAQGVKTLAIGYTGGDLYGGNGEKATVEFAEKAGIQVVLDEAYDQTSTDFTPLITKVVAAKPDAFVVWGAGPAPVIITKQIAGKGVPTYVTGAEASDLYLQPAGDAAEGVVAAATVALAGDALPDGPYKSKVMAVVKPWQDANNGATPPEFAFGGASGIELLASAIDRADSTDRQKIRDALEQTDLLTSNGHYTYSATDHMGLDATSLAIFQVEGGKWVPTDYATKKFATELPQ